MRTLYEIDEEINKYFDPETGEILNETELEKLELERSAKCEAVAVWVKTLAAEVEAIDNERTGLLDRKITKMKQIESLKNWLSRALDGHKFETSKCLVGFRRSESVNIFEADAIPAEFLREKITVEPDKTEIKKALKLGNAVPGCELQEKLNINIK